MKTIEAVEKLNYEIWEQLGEPNDFWSNLKYETNGVNEIITFAGEMIWGEDMFQPYIEEKDDYQDLEEYLREQVNKQIGKFNKIKL